MSAICFCFKNYLISNFLNVNNTITNKSMCFYFAVYSLVLQGTQKLYLEQPNNQ